MYTVFSLEAETYRDFLIYRHAHHRRTWAAPERKRILKHAHTSYRHAERHPMYITPSTGRPTAQYFSESLSPHILIKWCSVPRRHLLSVRAQQLVIPLFTADNPFLCSITICITSADAIAGTSQHLLSPGQSCFEADTCGCRLPLLKTQFS